MIIGGWRYWAKTGDVLRQFDVAVANEKQALAALLAEVPGLEVLSRHCHDKGLMKFLCYEDGKIVELVNINPKDKFTHVGGTPMDKPFVV